MNKQELKEIVYFAKNNDLMEKPFKDVLNEYLMTKVECKENLNNFLSVKIVNKSNNPLPEYKTAQSAGMDLRAYIENGAALVIEPGLSVLVHTGIHIQLPEGCEAQVRSRSGLALKHGIVVLNSPGTIDADYTGEVCVILHNTGSEDFQITNGDRIAQLVVAKYETVKFQPTEVLDETERADKGWGHSGVK